MDAEILAYYEHGLEKDRLNSGGRQVEFFRIRDLLRRHLPPAPARILDVGGGAGSYALPLATAGYEVHLVDRFRCMSNRSPRHRETHRSRSPAPFSGTREHWPRHRPQWTPRCSWVRCIT
jgi:hypothetical protein